MEQQMKGKNSPCFKQGKTHLIINSSDSKREELEFQLLSSLKKAAFREGFLKFHISGTCKDRQNKSLFS